MSKATASFLSLLLVSAVAGIQPSLGASSNYDAAIEALNRGDCATAVAALERFKTEEANQLKTDPRFAALVEEQIAVCKQRLAAPAPSIRTKGQVPDPREDLPAVKGGGGGPGGARGGLRIQMAPLKMF